MENRDLASEMKDRAEMLQIVGAMSALQYQMNAPTYEGMIAALRNAQYLASSEIQGAINQSAVKHAASRGQSLRRMSYIICSRHIWMG